MKRDIENLYNAVAKCRICHAKCGISVPLPDRVPERTHIPYLFIGEQPDRGHAALSTRNGMRNAGAEMERLRAHLEKAGVREEDVFYVTSVLCLPEEESARRGRPALSEVKKCTRHLSQIIRIADPQVIVPLGHTPVQALQWIYSDWAELKQFMLNFDVGKILRRDGMAVYPLYPTAAGTYKARPEARQARDWMRLPSVLGSVTRAGSASN